MSPRELYERQICDEKTECTEHVSKPSVNLVSIGGSVVEFSPATRVTRVRFPADAKLLPEQTQQDNCGSNNTC